MVERDDICHDWTVAAVETLLTLPLLDLLYRAQTLHRRYPATAGI
jgi:biotin synthase